MSKRRFKWLWIILALLFLFEAWFWDTCQAIWRGSFLYQYWKRFEPRFRVWLLEKPIWVSLCVFLIPILVIEPFQILCLWLIAEHYIFTGVMFLVIAKFIGLGLFAIAFDLTRDKLLTSPLLFKFYHVIMAWRLWAHELTQPYTELLRQTIHRLKVRLTTNSSLSHRIQHYKELLIRLRTRVRPPK
ncbi:MAG: hypothetical protein EBY21_04360 [Alphaproteobacteria bacterium]|nr:hypothetical protein [Alphaproteobacteria bacterium]